MAIGPSAEGRVRGESEKYMHLDLITPWSPDVWIIQQNVNRLKRWISIEYDDARKQRLTRILESQQQQLAELESDSEQ